MSKVYEIVTERLITLIEESQSLVWQQSWTGSASPMNWVSKKPYRGLNRIFLGAFSNNPYWMTFKQIKGAGGILKKGSKSTPVIYWNWLHFKDGKKVKTQDEADKSVPMLRYYNVFNATDIEGIEFTYPDVVRLDEAERIEKCEGIVEGVKGLKLHHGGSKAYYSPMADYIQMPEFASFKSPESYYSVLFHELVHWTGHSSRLDRGLDIKLCSFGSTDYSKEELVAEMGASFMCEYAQISNEQTQHNSAAYLKGWMKRLKGDVKLLVTAGGQAQKSADLLIGE